MSPSFFFFAFMCNIVKYPSMLYLYFLSVCDAMLYIQQKIILALHSFFPSGKRAPPNKAVCSFYLVFIKVNQANNTPVIQFGLHIFNTHNCCCCSQDTDVYKSTSKKLLQKPCKQNVNR